MEDGRIVEQGSHRELLELEGAYARLYESQFAGPTDHQESSVQDGDILPDSTPES
jgi:ATP-binding cassette subfamily B protein